MKSLSHLEISSQELPNMQQQSQSLDRDILYTLLRNFTKLKLCSETFYSPANVIKDGFQVIKLCMSKHSPLRNYLIGYR